MPAASTCRTELAVPAIAITAIATKHNLYLHENKCLNWHPYYNCALVPTLSCLNNQKFTNWPAFGQLYMRSCTETSLDGRSRPRIARPGIGRLRSLLVTNRKGILVVVGAPTDLIKVLLGEDEYYLIAVRLCTRPIGAAVDHAHAKSAFGAIPFHLEITQQGRFGCRRRRCNGYVDIARPVIGWLWPLLITKGIGIRPVVGAAANRVEVLLPQDKHNLIAVQLGDLDGLYLLLDGIAAVLSTTATLAFVRANPFPRSKGTYG